MAAEGLAGGPGGGAATLGWPTGPAGAAAPSPGRVPGPPGGGPPGAVLALGFTAFGATAALGGGGAPLAPGTGSAFGRDRVWFGGSAPGALAGRAGFGLPACPGAPGKPVLAAGLIAALGGAGALPCWISVARCATAGGSVGVAPPACPGANGVPGRPFGLPPGPPSGAPPIEPPGAGRLMTLLMAARLWILAKMMLFGGGAMYRGGRT